LAEAWIFCQATLPPLHLRLHVVAVADGGAAATAGVGKGWTATWRQRWWMGWVDGWWVEGCTFW
jgi:hypothetical protein